MLIAAAILCFTGIQFLNIIELDGTMQLSQSDDVFSDPIYFRDGVPVGTTVETTAHVSMQDWAISHKLHVQTLSPLRELWFWR